MKDVILYNQVKICKWIHWCWFTTLEQVCIYYNCEHLAQVKPNPASIHDILILNSHFLLKSININQTYKRSLHFLNVINSKYKQIDKSETYNWRFNGWGLFVCYIVYIGVYCILRTADLFLSILILIFKLWNFCWIIKWHSKVN